MKFIADTHTHTVASTHAFSTILENARVAADRGLKYLAITDHSSNDEEDAPHIWHFHNLPRVVDRELFGVKMLFGVETSIVGRDGALNMERADLTRLDWVIASVHFPVEGVHDYTDVYAAVAENPLVDVIGHSANRHYSFDYDKILPMFRDNHKLVEINDSRITHYGRAAEYEELALKCKEHRVPVIVNSDAHFCYRVGDKDGAEKILTQTDFPTDLIVNASEEAFSDYLKIRRKNDLWI
jgi:putative hydrolase